MVNYNNAKIYKITNTDNDMIYIGSTTKKLCERLAKHRSDEKRKDIDNSIYTTSSYEILKYNGVRIELIEAFSCNNIEELRAREGQHIRMVDCINKNIPGRPTDEQQHEWYMLNRDRLIQKSQYKHDQNREEDNKRNRKNYYDNRNERITKQMEYYEKNKERIHQKYLCICGSTVSKQHKARHEQSDKHKKYIV